MIDLPKQAIDELKDILRDELEEEAFNSLNECDIHQMGIFILQVIATSLKKRERESGFPD